MRLDTARILVADDEPFTRAALAELLRDEACTVATAEDGLCALSMLAEFSPDVVLTDLKMPRLDGIGLLRNVRERVPACRVIVMSANDSLDGEDTAEVVRRAGAAGFFVKPLDFDELLRGIKLALACCYSEALGSAPDERLTRHHDIPTHCIYADGPGAYVLLGNCCNLCVGRR